ncbi:MAG: tetratricopeptide repeat protein [Pirellulales bacterium]|nr:tetratricopeptide repeat protein [Pirellulales bacterium]
MTHHVQRARLLMDQSRWDLAEKELRQALSLDAQDAQAHALLALCQSARNKHGEARREAQAAIHAAPDHWFTHYAQAHVLWHANRAAEARRAVAEAIRLEPRVAELWGLLAMIEHNLKQWDRSLAAARRGLAIDPEDAMCVNAESMALVKLGRAGEAHARLDDALARDPENAWSHANQGWTLLEKGEVRRAQERFREALRLEPELDWARHGMVTALKARNPVYRVLLTYFLWTSRLGSGAQWALVIGLVIGYNVVRNLADAQPALRPLLVPLMVGYIMFVFTSWLADPLSHLVLRLSRFGRYVLSKDERMDANLVAACVAGALAAFVASLVWNSGNLLFAAIACLMLAIPCSAIMRCDRGWPRHAMILYTVVLAAVGLTALFGSLLGVDSLETLGVLFLLGAIASSYVGSALMSATPKR